CSRHRTWRVLCADRMSLAVSTDRGRGLFPTFRTISDARLLTLTRLLTSARLRAFVAELAAVVVELFHQCVQLPLLVLVKDIEHRRLLFNLRGVGPVDAFSARCGQRDVLRLPLLLSADPPLALQTGGHPVDAAAAGRQARGEVGLGDRLEVADISHALELGDGHAELPQVLVPNLIAV